MSKKTEFGYLFEFETPQEKDRDYWIKVETELDSGGYTFSIYQDSTCNCEITEIVKDLNIEIYREIDKQTFKESENVRQTFIENEPRLSSVAELMDELMEVISGK